MLASSSFLSRSVGLATGRNPRTSAAAMMGAVRYLNVHEYITMELFQSYGVQTPKWFVASTPEEAEEIYLKKLNEAGSSTLKDVVIKAQVVTGGRTQGYFADTNFQGGVHMVTQPGQAREMASQMLGHALVTKRAPPPGVKVEKVLLEERMYLRREFYVSIFMDRISQSPMIAVSPQGGMPVDEIAERFSESISTEPIDIMDGLQEDQCQRSAQALGLEPGTPTFDAAVTTMHNLYIMFLECDCTQVEVNPLAETPNGDLVVCDAKVNFDDNAKFRQPALFERRDTSQEDPREVEAAAFDLNYIHLLDDGNIGCMVNGAGLAMATNDIIKLKGGAPANFLDVGGGSSSEQVEKAFEILNNDSQVKAILINIFGGIMRCDVIATGIINAAKVLGIQKPIVIRIQGTNVEEARTLIEGCGFKMILAEDLEDAAEKVVGVAEIASRAEKINVGVQFDGLGL